MLIFFECIPASYLMLLFCVLTSLFIRYIIIYYPCYHVCPATPHSLSKKEEGSTGITGPLARRSTVGFPSAGLKVMGLDLLKGTVIWTVEPTLESGRVLSSASKECELKGKEEKDGECSAVAFTRLVIMHSNPQGAEVTLLVSLVSGASYAWHLDASTGRVIPPHLETPGLNRAFKGPLVGALAVEKKNEDGMKGDLQYILVRNTAVLIPPSSTNSDVIASNAVSTCCF
jgi:hypothetical protein